MICIKFDQKTFKNFRLLRFLVFFIKKPKNLGFSKPFSSPDLDQSRRETAIIIHYTAFVFSRLFA